MRHGDTICASDCTLGTELEVQYRRLRDDDFVELGALTVELKPGMDEWIPRCLSCVRAYRPGVLWWVTSGLFVALVFTIDTSHLPFLLGLECPAVNRR